MKHLTDAGVRVYALSYDEADALRDFQQAYGMTYKLLSDPDSVVIRQFGILNTLIAEDDHPWFGIPYPGTYVLDAGGVITHKFFENNLAVRVGPEQLLRAVRGESVVVEAVEPIEPGKVATRIYLEGDTLAVSVQRDLVADLAVPPGRHVYASPAPEGTVAVTLELDANPRIVKRELIRPPSESHSLGASGEVFQVHHDRVQLRLPVTVNGRLTVDDDNHAVTLSGILKWQTCDDEVCDIPASERFEISIPVEGSIMPSFMGKSDQKSPEPNAGKHFQRMMERREESGA
ncbi:MAG: hypothetical protein CMQ20_08975 [Gammaproteobacteria bacterium]|jgi:hypothetical protein|nr:hypothetical protein [Gammaproteobacteria bacterium]|tara:strand:- start:225 stop:1091 length:867 start_codon:yes stop_codon:yes gene_type:complete